MQQLSEKNISKITANTIEFDFLGKDSVRWQEIVVAEGHDKQFHENLKKNN